MQKYNVIDVRQDGMGYAPWARLLRLGQPGHNSGQPSWLKGDEIIGVVEAADADAAIAAVMAQVGFTSAVIAMDPYGYARYVLPMVAALPVA